MEVSGQLHSPAAVPPEKELQVAVGQGGPRVDLDAVVKKQSSKRNSAS